MYRGKGRLGIEVNGDLGLGVPGEGTVGIDFDIGFNGCDDFVCQVKTKRQTALGLCGGIAEHNALVTRAGFGFGGDSIIDFVGLLADKIDNGINGACGACYDTYLLLSVIMGIRPFGEEDKMPLGTLI